MKYLSFAVPCYNSADYMSRCIDSLLTGGDKIEIIIINDGSTDATGLIADEYQAQYPNMVKVVHQHNQGHGEGVNAGLRNAAGKYFKVVDSDDWLDTGALQEILMKMEEWEEKHLQVDMLVCNYIYDHLYEGKQRRIQYRNVFKSGEISGWDEIGVFLPTQYLIMHALIFNTSILKQSGVELPKHMFYVDNIFACQPLPDVNRIMYLDIDLYHYFLGREDQSVNEKVMIKRIDQQIAVTKIVSECIDINQVKQRKLAAYLCRNISIMMAISSIHLLLIGSEEAIEKRNELWRYIKENNYKLYRKLRFQTLSGFTYLPGRIGNIATVTGYRAARKVVKFQ